MMISTAQFGLLILLFLFLLMHVFILLKIIPYAVIWGGRLKSDSEMYRFEVFSVLITSLFIIIVLAQAGFVIDNIPKKVITVTLWLMTGLFLLNTIGNAISKNTIERLVFTPLTIVMALFSFILAMAE